MLQQAATQKITALKRAMRPASQAIVIDSPGARASHCLLLWLQSLELSSSSLLLSEEIASSPVQTAMVNEIRINVLKIPALLMSAGRQVVVEDVKLNLKLAHSMLLEVNMLFEGLVDYHFLQPTDQQYCSVMKQTALLDRQLVELIKAC